MGAGLNGSVNGGSNESESASGVVQVLDGVQVPDVVQVSEVSGKVGFEFEKADGDEGIVRVSRSISSISQSSEIRKMLSE